MPMRARPTRGAYPRGGRSLTPARVGVGSAPMSALELEHAYDTVLLRRRGGELRIELNRPESMNAWDRQLGEDLLAAVRRAHEDDSVRAVVVTGAGRAFSSGADLK